MNCQITPKCKKCFPRPCMEAPERDYQRGELQWMLGIDPAKRLRVEKVCKCGRHFTHAYNMPSDICPHCRNVNTVKAFRKRHGAMTIGKVWDHVDPVKVAKLIKDKGCSYSSTERILGVGHGSVVKWVTQGQGISRENLAKLALFLGVEIDDIVKEVA